MISRDTFDSHLKGALDTSKCAQPLKDLWAKYQLAKSKLPPEVLSWIPKTEPNLSDHGILHIDNVIENAARLLNLNPNYCPDGTSEVRPFNNLDIKPVEAFILGMALMFHDTGNLFGRKGHAAKGRELIHSLMKNILKADEVRCIDQVMAAHSGTAKDGTPDTIRSLPDTPVYICREPVRVRQLAAVVRLADELAEGPQRTSQILRDRGKFIVEPTSPQNDSETVRNLFHDYASLTTINIDRGNGRLAIQYNIDLDDKMILPGDEGREQLKLLLQIIFSRIRKTDDERRYARFYGGTLLANFHTTEILLQFHRGCIDVDTGLHPLVINDLVIPQSQNISNEDQGWIRNQDKDYDINSLLEKVWP